MSLLLFTVARLRLFAISVLALAGIIHAREETLFTSSVSYCAPPESLLIQQFDVAYIASNSSVNFNISAASVDSGVNVTANLLLNVYGMHPVNLTIDLCSLLNGALCPLPTYNFTGIDSVPLSSYVNVSDKIPAIAYKVPDLEGYVQLVLAEVGTGTLKACVQATLSNGWSMHQAAVEWSTRGLVLLALASALWQSLSPDSLAPYRLLDLIYLYQSIAVSGLLSLNYPLAYRSFTLNFAWALGLFSSNSIQSSIDDMRIHTGGSSDDGSGGSALALTNRKLSPYNAIIISNADSNAEYSTFTASSYSSPVFLVNNPVVLAAGDVATVTTTSDNVLEAGIPIYVNTIDISSTNSFMTVFLVVLILSAIAIGATLVTILVLRVSARLRPVGSVRESRLREGIPIVVRSWFLRLVLVVMTPVVLFSFYQWTLKDSWLSVLLSVVLFVAVLTFICYSAFLALRSQDFDSMPFHTPLWGQYRSNRHWFFIPLGVASVCKSIVVSLAKGHDKVQVILMIIVEFGVLASVLVFKPHHTRGGDVLSSYLSIVRLICTGLLVAFIQDMNLAAIPRVAIGIVTAVIFSIAVIVMFVNTIFHLVQAFRSPQSAQRIPSDRQSDEASVLEKGKDSQHQSVP